MEKQLKRIYREKHTLSVMIMLYCNNYHETDKNTLCAECDKLLMYAMERIDKCPFSLKKLKKPTCLNCPVHCYKRDVREAIKNIMRYSGPRMLTRHPVLTLFHFIDGSGKPEDIVKDKNVL